MNNISYDIYFKQFISSDDGNGKNGLLLFSMESAQYLRTLLESLKGVRYKNLSQLAEKAEIPQGNLSEFMNGKRNNLNFDTVWKLFKALGLEFPIYPGNCDKSGNLAEKNRIEYLKAELDKAQGKIEGLKTALELALISNKSLENKEKISALPTLTQYNQNAG